MANNIKMEKLNSLISRELTIILSREYLTSKILPNIIIHEVKTSNDFSFSKIYFSTIINDKDITVEMINNKLNKKNKDIRHKLSKKLTIYKTPKLIFIYDNSLENANKIQSILNDINDKDKVNK